MSDGGNMKNKIHKIILSGILVVCLTGCQKEITSISSNTNNECNNKANLLIKQEGRKIYNILP